MGNLHAPSTRAYEQKLPVKRLRLSEATDSPTLLYVAGTWAMTEAMKKQLSTTQRRMIRRKTNTKKRVLGTKNKTNTATKLNTKTLSATHHLWEKAEDEEENLVDFRKRSTKDAEASMQNHKVADRVRNSAKAMVEASSNSGFTRRREMDESSSEIESYTDANTRGAEKTREAHEKMGRRSRQHH